MSRFVYRGKKTKEISFPLGGIGTGCIGLAGNGSLIDWEIFNRPNKASINGFSHLAIKAEAAGQVLDARVLNVDLQPPYTGEPGRPNFEGFGFGPHRTTMAGVPHFRNLKFTGEFPLARLDFGEEKFPGIVSLTAFNPFIPLNDQDSSIPAAFFEIEVENDQEQEINYTIAVSLNNPFPRGTTINQYQLQDMVHLINLKSSNDDQADLEYGELSIASNAENVSYQEYWYRGKWFDNLEVFWREFSSPGKLKNRQYATLDSKKLNHHDPGADVATLAVHLTIAPGEKNRSRFILSWNFPNNHNYWNPGVCNSGDEQCQTESSHPKNSWKNYYATVFADSRESAIYSLENWDRLYHDTIGFKNALFSSSLPEVAIEAISANLSTLKSPTCLRLEDGSFYGFEGCHCNSGCCEGSCTHVWNYAYALPFLFPKLERSMRELDFKYNQREDGGMAFRLQLPLDRERSGFRPCVDGQFGGVIKSYREWKISGDKQWLEINWPAIKKSIEFAWSESNEDKWDFNQDGVLEGRQHHTLDMELFGPNSWLTGFYLAALKAGAEMAAFLGEEGTASKYLALFEQGKNWVDKHLFNGEYYQQMINLKDKTLLEKYSGMESLIGGNTVDSYWNDEADEIKYQIATGCEIDQVIAQWHANLCGLGEIFNPEQTRRALQALYKYNFKKDMRDHFNPCRLYSLNDEAGIVICEWPADKYKPAVPLPYAEETQNGYEYQAAIQMIQTGLVAEGIEIVKAIRDRYDGTKRNPWNEFECGNNYARSMASYALLLAFSGFKYDAGQGKIGFDPINLTDVENRYFWSLDSGWGLLIINNRQVELQVNYGQLLLCELNLPFVVKRNYQVQGISLGDQGLKYQEIEGKITFKETTVITKGNSLVIVYA